MAEAGGRSGKPYFSELSQGLLERIFQATEFEFRHSTLPLVCRKFNEILKDGPQLWRTAVIRLPAKRELVAWYAARAGRIQELTVWGECSKDGNELPSCHLLTALLTMAATTKPGGSLSKLVVQLMHVADPHILTAVCQLTALRTLCLDSFSIPPQTQVLSDLRHLINLEHLSLKRSLVDMETVLSMDQTMCLWQSIGHLSRLDTLDLSHMVFSLDLSTCDSSAIPPLSHLRRLTLSCNQLLAFLPLTSSRLTGLKRLELCEDIRTLNLESLGSLKDLRLKLFPYSDLDLTLPTSLRSLQICGIGHNRSSSLKTAWQKAFSSQVYNLQQLFLEELALESLPEPVAQLRALRVLSLASNKLEDLPTGPYLEKLEILDLHSNFMRSICPSLEGCSKLRELYVELNVFLYPSEACLRVLLSLQALAVLGVDQSVLDFYHTKLKHGLTCIEKLISVACRLPVSDLTGTYVKPPVCRCLQS